MKTAIHTLILLSGVFSLLSHNAAAQSPVKFNGYIEAEYTYLSAPASGWLRQLHIQAGDTVQPGQLLFSLDSDSQQIQIQQAHAQLEQAQATLADLQIGARPDEIKNLQAQLAEANATLKLSTAEKERWSRLASQGNASQSQKDQAVNAWQVAQAKVKSLEASLHLAQLGARDEQIRSAQAAVKINQANLAQAEWQLSQRTIYSPLSGKVERVFHRLGEFVAANTPIAALITPQHLKVKFYLPQSQLSNIQLGQSIQLSWDGQSTPILAKINFISDSAEFTPPIIFSQKSRQKLVYLVEARLENSALRAGQPVDIQLTLNKQTHD